MVTGRLQKVTKTIHDVTLPGPWFSWPTWRQASFPDASDLKNATKVTPTLQRLHEVTFVWIHRFNGFQDNTDCALCRHAPLVGYRFVAFLFHVFWTCPRSGLPCTRWTLLCGYKGMVGRVLGPRRFIYVDKILVIMLMLASYKLAELCR